MRYTLLRALACMALSWATLGHSANTGPAYNAADTTELNAVADHWREYWNAHDMEKFAGLFADDVDFVTKSGSWFRGKEATMEHHRKNHAGIFKDSTWTTDQVVIKYVQPDVAIIHIGWGLSGDSHHDGTASAPRHGISTWVLVKRAGKWLLLAVQNVNIEPPK